MSRIARHLLMARDNLARAATPNSRRHWGQKLRELSRYLLDTER